MISNEESERLVLSKDLVALRRPIPEIVNRLREYSWDVDHPVLFVTAADVARVLKAYPSGEISADTVSEWADALEMKEDIEHDERLAQFFLEASSPEIFEPVSESFARRWLAHLGCVGSCDSR